jgi:hypothetical protein
MPAENTANQKARVNLRLAIDASRQFPKNVFSGKWDGFLFFDSDWIFDAQFVERSNVLLEIEGGNSVCMSNLDVAPSTERSLFFIDKGITGQAYTSFLSEPNVEEGWIYGVDRFGCTSDVGQWCIYCERRNEIAVIAVRGNRAAEKYRPAIVQFKAQPIDQALAIPLSHGFSARALSAEWRGELLKQYA